MFFQTSYNKPALNIFRNIYKCAVLKIFESEIENVKFDL